MISLILKTKKPNNLLISIFTLFISLFLILNTNYAFSESAKPIGKILKLSGQAYILNAQNEKRSIRIGSSLYEQDTVFTEGKSSITIFFNDKTRFELGSDSSLKANEYKFQNNSEDDSVSIKILKGTFRFITGLIAKSKPENMEISTAVATIGIRGTHVVGEADANSATIILVEPEDKSRKSAIDVYNDFGKVHIDEPGYGTEIPDQFSPPSPPRRMSMRTINNLTRSLQTMQRMNIPRPR